MLEAADHVVERLESTRHLEADEIVTDAFDHRRHSIKGGTHRRVSRAIAVATAS
uniref:IstB domain-containing protein ATP-binding protein n=1 Tax=Rhizobium meliloti TaxID=382 RepID=I2E1M9_RHIML|nr:IstB domain-containing protein ATP-binding protein [Sinorhizobium meliloti]